MKIKLNFRQAYTVVILVFFMILVATPFWIGSNGLKPESWNWLSTAFGVISTLLIQASRTWFEPKQEITTPPSEPCTTCGR